MKARTGFVSNSSSASFILDMGKLTNAQIKKIKHHIHDKEFKRNVASFKGYNDRDEWRMKEVGSCLILETNMTNFDMEEYLEYIGASGAIEERWYS